MLLRRVARLDPARFVGGLLDPLGIALDRCGKRRADRSGNRKKGGPGTALFVPAKEDGEEPGQAAAPFSVSISPNTRARRP